MGQDQGIRCKHKQKTAPHSKHSAFPGMYTPKGTMIVNQSIKPINTKPYIPAPPMPKPISYSDERWIAYDTAARRLGALGGSVAQATRSKNEHEFFQTYRVLVRSKMAYPLKRRYRP